MPAQSNIEMLEKVCASLESSKGLFIIDYRGLSVKETQELRRQLRKCGAEMKVYKNNIVRIALEKNELPAVDDYLKGTVACVFYEDDPAAAAKAVKETSKKLNKIEFRGGIVDGSVLTAEEALAIAELPSKEQLLGQIAGLISGFSRDIAVCVNGVSSGLARSIQQVSEQKAA